MAWKTCGCVLKKPKDLSEKHRAYLHGARTHAEQADRLLTMFLSGRHPNMDAEQCVGSCLEALNNAHWRLSAILRERSGR